MGDRGLEIDGVPAIQAMRTPVALEVGRVNHYVMLKSGGRVIEASLFPVPSRLVGQPIDGLLQVTLLGVAIFFLLVAGLVWWGKPDRDETWALLLFSCSASVLLATSVRADLTPWAASLAIANLPLLGATSFHLFTSYPVQPGWLARQPRLRAIPYLLALGISTMVVAGPRLAIPPEWAERTAFFYCAVLTIAALSILGAERRTANKAGLGERADLMLAAGTVTLLPGLVIAFLPQFISAPVPWYAALLSMTFFPLAVSYGMLRRQLFDYRMAARSSATYAVASLVVTGGFAFLIAFTDEIVLLSGVTARWVQILALFLAILAFDPLRERIQMLVDRLFDRDRARYRQAVSEISQAMVSTLTIEEIRERILTALTDTTGVGKAMLMQVDETDGSATPVAWRGSWRDAEKVFSLPRFHPVLRALQARKQELARIDIDDEPDPHKRRIGGDLFFRPRH